MADKKTYYKLDEAGMVGTKKVISTARQEYYKRKTAGVFMIPPLLPPPLPPALMPWQLPL